MTDVGQARFGTATCEQYPDPLVLSADWAPDIESPPLFVDGLSRCHMTARRKPTALAVRGCHYTTQNPPRPYLTSTAYADAPGWASRLPSLRAHEWIVVTDQSGTHLAHQPKSSEISDWTLIDWLLAATDRWGVLDIAAPKMWPEAVLARVPTEPGWSR